MIFQWYNFQKKSMLENFRANVIKPRVVPLSLSTSSVTRKKTVEKMSRVKSWGREVRVFFRVTHDGVSERGTTRSLEGLTVHFVLKTEQNVTNLPYFSCSILFRATKPRNNFKSLSDVLMTKSRHCHESRSNRHSRSINIKKNTTKRI